VNRATRATDEVLLRAEGVVKHFSTGRRKSSPVVQAVDDVSLEVRRGETLGLVGDRLRQVDARPLPDPPLRADRGPRRVRRQHSRSSRRELRALPATSR
jgi:hypothetical protein